MPKNILYVEDNRDSITFFNCVANKLGDYTFKIPGDGVSAIKLLEEEKDFEPEMILLDINLSGKDGFEILKYVKSQTTYRHVPVIMFTSSNDHQDIEKSYEFGANAYLIKPNNLHRLRKCWKTLLISG
jgi:two-component system response regulator